MTGKSVKNPAASIRARLFNHARQHGDDFQRVITRYAIERLLFRLSQTSAVERYVLKGAMLFVTWPEHVGRPTQDLDLLGHGEPDVAAIGNMFSMICEVDASEDGLIFDRSTLRVDTMREADKYPGAQLTIKVTLDKAVIHVQIDIGFGDHVHPPAARRAFPALLAGMPSPSVLMYPPETVIAEKLEAMIRFGELNGRVKDFYDIWAITRTFPFELSTLVDAVGGTLRRRETEFPKELPVSLGARFATIAEGKGLWSGFLRRTPPTLPPPSFPEMQEELRRFISPIIRCLDATEYAQSRWDPSERTWRYLPR